MNQLNTNNHQGQCFFYNLDQIHYSELIARIIQKDAKEIDFEYNFFGKPYLKNYPLFFNVSHKGSLGILAIDAKKEVGIDIERSDLEIKAISKVLHPNESKILSLCSPTLQSKLIPQLFSTKEAILKAIGIGLMVPPKNIDLSPHIHEQNFTYLFNILNSPAEVCINRFTYFNYVLALATLSPGYTHIFPK